MHQTPEEWMSSNQPQVHSHKLFVLMLIQMFQQWIYTHVREQMHQDAFVKEESLEKDPLTYYSRRVRSRRFFAAFKNHSACSIFSAIAIKRHFGCFKRRQRGRATMTPKPVSGFMAK